MANDDVPTTEELRAAQARVARQEREAAVEEPTDAGERAHQRRADKAAYLEGKLAERQQADEES